MFHDTALPGGTGQVSLPDCAVAADRGTGVRAAWDDARLVRACLDGDQEAWAAIIQRYKRLIYSIPMRYGARPEDAADVFQAVCLELFAELPRLRRIESLRAWLITVTAHQAFHWKRRHGRRASREADAIEADAVAVAPVAPDVLEAAEREQLLRDAIGRLPPRCAELIHLLFFEATPIPYKEVGRRLGLATGSIGFIRGRCLTKLQRALEDEGFSAVTRADALVNPRAYISRPTRSPLGTGVVHDPPAQSAVAVPSRGRQV